MSVTAAKATVVQARLAERKPQETGVSMTRREYKRARITKFLIGVLIAAGLPTLAAGVYYGFFASDYYIAESRFVVNTSEASASGALEGFLGAQLGGFSVRETLVVQSFILSRDALRRLDEEENFIALYKSPEIDWLSRLPADASFQDAFEYYQDLVEVETDHQSGVAILRLRAPNAEAAQRLSAALLTYSEDVVNRLSDRAQQDQIGFALDEVKKAETRLLDARLTLLTLQQKVEEFNPIQSASGVASIRLELESELAKTRTEMEALEAVLQPNAHQLVQLRNKVASLERQIKLERERLVSNEEGSLNASASSFEAAAFEKQFAEEAYQSTLRFLEISRIEAAQKSHYLSVVSEPDLPDEALYPARLRSVVTVFGVSLALYFLAAMLLAVIREHVRR